MWMAKERKVLGFYSLLNLTMKDVFSGSLPLFVYLNPLHKLWSLGWVHKSTGEWAEQNCRGERAQILRLPSLSYRATTKEMVMCNEITCTRAWTKSVTLARCNVWNFAYRYSLHVLHNSLVKSVFNITVILFWVVHRGCSWGGRSTRPIVGVHGPRSVFSGYPEYSVVKDFSYNSKLGDFVNWIYKRFKRTIL